MIDVLVTCGGGFQGLAILKSLKGINNIETHLFDTNEESVSKYFSDHYVISKAVEYKSNYIEDLRAYCAAFRIDFVIPATDFDVSILAKLKKDFYLNYKTVILVPDIDVYEEMRYKKTSYIFLKKFELPIQELLEKPKILNFPILAKPNYGSGGKGIKRIDDLKTFKSIDHSTYHFVEYYHKFKEYSVDFSVSQGGICCEPILRERVSVSTGFSVISESRSKFNKIFSKYLEKIKSSFSREKYSGIYNLQFIVNDEEKVFFTDLNCRIGTSAVTSNVDNESLIAHVIGSGNQSKLKNVKTIRYLEELHIPILDLGGVKGVVFDLDDTLICNKAFILSRCLKLYDSCDLFWVSRQDFKLMVLAFLNEGKAPTLIDEICRHYCLEEKKAQVLSNYRNCFPDSLSFLPKVEIMFSKLKKLGLKIFILTDNPLSTQKMKVKLLDLESRVDGIYYTSNQRLPKPDQINFVQISKENDLDVNELVMVGDNEYRDIFGALKANYKHAFWFKNVDGMVSNSLYNELTHNERERITIISDISNLAFYFN